MKNRLTAENFTDGDMRAVYTACQDLLESGQAADYSVLAHSLPQQAAQTLAGIFARNADIIITEKDVLMHIENLLTAKLSQREAGEKSVEEIARRIELLKGKKK